MSRASLLVRTATTCDVHAPSDRHCPEEAKAPLWWSVGAPSGGSVGPHSEPAGRPGVPGKGGHPAQAPLKEAAVGKILRTLLLVLVGLVAAFLATQNNQTLSLRFFVWESMELPVWVFLLIALAIGIIIGGASLLVDYVRLRAAARRERRRADEAVLRAEEEARRAEHERRRADELAREVEALRSVPGRPGEEHRTDLEVFDEEPEGTTAIARPGAARSDPFE